MEEGEDDEDINTNDTSTPTQVPVSGPITRARARQINHQEPWRRPKGKRTRAGWIRTPGQYQLVMVTTVAYGHGLGRSSASRICYEVYFHMDLDSSLYLVLGGRNDQFTTDRFSGAASPYFGPMGRVSSWVH